MNKEKRKHEEFECNCCGIVLTKEQIKIEKKLNTDMSPCYCDEVILIDKKNKQIRKLKDEIEFLNILLSSAQPEGWDLNGIYEDALEGRDEYTGKLHEPNIPYAKWIKKRYLL